MPKAGIGDDWAHSFDRLVGGRQDRCRGPTGRAPSPGTHLAGCRFALVEPSLSFLVNNAPAALSISIATLSSVPAEALCARLIRATFFDTRPWSCTLPFVV